MDTQSASQRNAPPSARELHPLEIKVLLHAAEGAELTLASLVAELSYNTGQANQALSWLAAKGFAAEKSRATRVLYEITDFGRECLDKGTYEERIVRLLAAEGPLSLPEIARKLGVEPKDVGSAFGGLSKDKVLAMDEEKRAALAHGGAENGSAAAVRGAALPGGAGRRAGRGIADPAGKGAGLLPGKEEGKRQEPVPPCGA